MTTDCIVNALQNVANTDYIGMAWKSATATRDMRETDVEVVSEDILAQTFAGLSCSWLGCRVKRMLHILRGWPVRFVLLHGGENQKGQIVEDFKQDVHLFRKYVAEPNINKQVAKILNHRSLLKIAPVQQYIATLEVRVWVATEELVEWQREKDLRMISSQIVEDCVHHETCVAGNKRMSDLRMYYQPIFRQVAENVHQFKSPVSVCSKPAPKSARIDDTAYAPPHRPETKCFRELEGTSPSVPWYSPSADARHVPIADLELLRLLEASDALDTIGDTDMVSLLKGHDDIIIKDNGGWHAGGAWLLPFAFLSNHSCIAWPITIKAFERADGQEYFDLNLGSNLQFGLPDEPPHLDGQEV